MECFGIGKKYIGLAWPLVIHELKSYDRELEESAPFCSPSPNGTEPSLSSLRVFIFYNDESRVLNAVRVQHETLPGLSAKTAIGVCVSIWIRWE